MFIADVKVPGVQDIAFVRSQMASAWVRRVIKPSDAAQVFTLADIGPVNVLGAGAELSPSPQSLPVRLRRALRYVCQTIAACLMPTRAEAEDLADGWMLSWNKCLSWSTSCPPCASTSSAFSMSGRATPISAPAWSKAIHDARRSANPSCIAVCGSTGRPPYRWRAAACLPIGTTGSTNLWSICRRRAAR